MAAAGTGCSGEDEPHGGRPYFKLISAKEAYDRTREDESICILDVRKRSAPGKALEFLDRATRLPLEEFGRRARDLEACRGRDLVVVDTDELRSLKASAELARSGYRTVYCLRGSLTRWVELAQHKEQG